MWIFFKRCHCKWINAITLIFPPSIFYISLHILFRCYPPFFRFLTLDWVINHSVQLGAHSHGLCDLEILAAFFSTWLALWQSYFTSFLSLRGQALSSHTSAILSTEIGSKNLIVFRQVYDECLLWSSLSSNAYSLERILVNLICNY